MSLPETEGIESKSKTGKEICVEILEYSNKNINANEEMLVAELSKLLTLNNQKWVPFEEIKKLDDNYLSMYNEILKQLRLRCDKLDKANKILNDLEESIKGLPQPQGKILVQLFLLLHLY